VKSGVVGWSDMTRPGSRRPCTGVIVRWEGPPDQRRRAREDSARGECMTSVTRAHVDVQRVGRKSHQGVTLSAGASQIHTCRVTDRARCGGTCHARYAGAVTDPTSGPSSGPAPEPGLPPRRPATTAHRVAGALTALEGLVLVGFTVFYVVEMVSGATDDLSRAAVSTVLILVFAVGLLALARGWFAAADWPKTPTVLWNALLLPVAWSLREGDRGALALAVGALALASIVAAVAAPRARRETSDT
jgi:hypothetical protein